jgi:gliding motility-associated protein GldE
LELLILGYIVIFAVLLLLSGFFSASETAYFSLSTADIERLKTRKDSPSRQAVTLLSNPKKLLISIVVGNTIVNIAAASLAAILTLDICSRLNIDIKIGVIIDVIIVTFVILIFSEIVPKVAAVKNSKKVAINFAFPLTIFYYIFSPIVSIFHIFTQWLIHLFRVDKSKVLLSEDELRSLVDVSEEKGTLEQDEKEMIHSIFEFGETTVKEIMVPRIDMVCTSAETDLSSLLDLVRNHMHSRIPIYQEKVDNIIGLIYAKDLLPFLDTSKNVDYDPIKLARPAYFVPEQKKIDELLREFQSEKIHMAIVVDEYGGTAGLVTLEDIIEEIVGEIQDEHDLELPQINKIRENEYIVDGAKDLEELNEELHFDLPTEEGVETLGGFLYGLFGSVPKEKQTVTFHGYEFIVEKIVRRRIKQVRIIKRETPPKTV